MKDKFAEIEQRIKDAHIPYHGGDANVFGTFSAFGSDESTDPQEAFKACHNGCTNLYRGKIYTCPACYVFRANNYFHANHEVPEGWDIYKYSGKELQSFLNKPSPFAAFVIMRYIGNHFPGKFPSEERRGGCRKVSQVGFCEFFGTTLCP